MNVVETTTDEGVRTINCNRPNAHNSLNAELRLALRDAFLAAAAACDDPDHHKRVRAVLLRAEGGAFCAGQDLKEQLQDTKAGTGKNKVVDEYNPMIAALLSIPVPVIAAIQGPAAGAGWGIAMACDFRIMSEAASFKGAFTGVGLSADCGLSASLANVVGTSRALELLIMDRKFLAKQAFAEQVVTALSMPSELDADAAAFARRLASGPTASYRELKALLKGEERINASAAAEAEAQARHADTCDHQEAVAAFVDKRNPIFHGY